MRCFLVPHTSGLALIDTGLSGSSTAIGSALAQLGAAWSDVTDVLLSHDHPAPAMFTADPEQAERSLRRIADIRADRLLPSHGAEVSQPFQAIRDLLDPGPANRSGSE